MGCCHFSLIFTVIPNSFFRFIHAKQISCLSAQLLVYLSSCRPGVQMLSFGNCLHTIHEVHIDSHSPSLPTRRLSQRNSSVSIFLLLTSEYEQTRVSMCAWGRIWNSIQLAAILRHRFPQTETSSSCLQLGKQISSTVKFLGKPRSG